jgi:3-oxoacyl-[acyl-carrier-protein] synthase-3
VETKSFIKAVSYYLPTSALDNEIIQNNFPEWSSKKIIEKTGIQNRYISAYNQTSGDMAIEAANKLFKEYNIDRASIDYLILCTQSPDYFLPTTACIIQEKLGLSTTIGAFDMNLGCSGYVYGLGLAKGLIQSKQAKNVLFITAETYTKFIHPDDKGNRTIFGDAAAATLISSESGFAEILNFEYGTNGKGAENLIVKNGALRNYNKNFGELKDKYVESDADDFLYMNGQEIFLFTLSAVPKLILKTLEKNSIQKENIDLYILHQANKFMLDSLMKKSNIEKDKFYVHIENCGNTVSSTIPIALFHAKMENKLSQGNHILLAGFGVGYSWGGTILKIIS